MPDGRHQPLSVIPSGERLPVGTLAELGKRHNPEWIPEFEYITLHLQIVCEPSDPNPSPDSEPLLVPVEHSQNLKTVEDDYCPQSAAAWAEALKLQNGSQQTLEAHLI